MFVSILGGWSEWWLNFKILWSWRLTNNQKLSWQEFSSFIYLEVEIQIFTLKISHTFFHSLTVLNDIFYNELGWLKNPKYCPSRSVVFFLIFTYGCLIVSLTSIQKYPVLLLSHVTTFNCFRRQLFFYFTLKVVDVFRWPNRQFFCLNFHERRQCDEANIVGCWKRSMTVSKEHA